MTNTPAAEPQRIAELEAEIARLDAVAAAQHEAARRNVPPADELGAVRDQLKVLKEREAVLRDLMLSDPSARTGNKLIAEVVDVTSQFTDFKELKAMHPDIVAPYVFTRVTKKVELREVDPDTGEITRRRKREQA